MVVKIFNRSGQSAGKASKENLGYYLSGFTDGEGSFNVSIINREKDYKHGWKVGLSFNISQKDDTIPKVFRDYIKCGKIRYRKDGLCYFEVRSIKDLKEIIIPFFANFPLLSNSKKKSFQNFCKVIQLMVEKKHLTRNGIEKIIELRDSINVGRKRKYTKKQILKSF